ELGRAQTVSHRVSALNCQRGIVSPLVRIADLVSDQMKLLFRQFLGLWAHPLQALNVSAQGGFDVVNHLQRLLFAGRWKLLLHIHLAQGLTQCPIRAAHATLPAWFLLGTAYQLTSVEIELFFIE